MPTMKILFFKDPNSDHFLNLNHFPKSFIKIILHSHLFKFLRHISESLIFFFSKKKKSNAPTFFLSALYISRMCSLYTFFFSFVHALECAYCTSILYMCHMIQFCLYFTLAKDGSYHVNLLSLF